MYIHRPETREEKPPLFGRIVFRSVLMTEIVLGGEEEVKFRIDRRPLWCKRFDKERVRRPIYNQLTSLINFQTFIYALHAYSLTSLFR